MGGGKIQIDSANKTTYVNAEELKLLIKALKRYTPANSREELLKGKLLKKLERDPTPRSVRKIIDAINTTPLSNEEV